MLNRIGRKRRSESRKRIGYKWRKDENLKEDSNKRKGGRKGLVNVGNGEDYGYRRRRKREI